jgi:hypothetical protein
VRRPRLLTLMLAALVAGCGGSKTETVTQITRIHTQTQSTTPALPAIQTPTATTPTTVAPPPPAGTRSQAAARVRAEGYVPDDPSQYRDGQTLRVLVATKKGSGDGYAKRAFFFVDGRYIGTDTSDDSAGIRVEGQSDTTVTLAYAIYGSKDPLCCPGATARVRYEWNGSRLVPLDPIPSASKRG